MEVGLLIVCVGAYVVFARRLQRSANRRINRFKKALKPQPARRRPHPGPVFRKNTSYRADIHRRRPPPPTPTATPAAFDADTARPPDAARTLQGPAYVIDGDTVVIQKTQIRLFGIDAPELDHPYGRNAKWAMVNLCKGQVIRAEVTAVDNHGRTVAKCFLPDGTDLSAALVEKELAIDWPKYSGGAYGHLEAPDLRRKLWLADARQKGNMAAWDRYEARQRQKSKVRS